MVTLLQLVGGPPCDLELAWWRQGFWPYAVGLPWHSRLEHWAGFHQSPLWQ